MQRFLERFPEFRAQENLLVHCPVSHTLKGVAVAASELVSGAFLLDAFVQPLFVPSEFIVLNIGWRIGGGEKYWMFGAGEPVDLACEIIRDEVLPFFTAIVTPLDLARSATSLKLESDWAVQQAIAYALARGGAICEAVSALDHFLRRFQFGRGLDWENEVLDRTHLLRSALVEDPATAQRLLDDWELSSIRNLRLEAFLQ